MIRSKRYKRMYNEAPSPASVYLPVPHPSPWGASLEHPPPPHPTPVSWSHWQPQCVSPCTCHKAARGLPMTLRDLGSVSPQPPALVLARKSVPEIL